jgi:hypothetical protein
MSFEFDPPTGLLDTDTYPRLPSDPTAARNQFQGLMNQLKDAHNAHLADSAYYIAAYTGVDKTGVTECTLAIQAAITAAGSRTMIFSSGTYLHDGITIPANSHVIFQNVKFERNAGTDGFVIFGAGCVIEGDLEIDGNKGVLSGGAAEYGIRLNDDCKALGHFYIHDCDGHGIRLDGDYIVVMSVESNDNGNTPGALGTGDGVKLTDCNWCKIFNMSASGNARMGLTITSNTAITDCTNNTVLTVHVTGNGYNDIDIEGCSYSQVYNVTGWGSLSASSSDGCTLVNLELKSLYAGGTNGHNYLTIKDVKIKPPASSVGNVFYVSGKDPYIDNLHVFDTATAYTASTVEVQDIVNSNVTIKNVLIENGNNCIVATGINFLENIKVLATSAVIAKLDTRRPTIIQSVRIEGGILTARQDAIPAAQTWKVGDRIICSIPTVGQPKAWICTVAGTPGTWVSEGNL